MASTVKPSVYTLSVSYIVDCIEQEFSIPPIHYVLVLCSWLNAIFRITINKCPGLMIKETYAL